MKPNVGFEKVVDEDSSTFCETTPKNDFYGRKKVVKEERRKEKEERGEGIHNLERQKTIRNILSKRHDLSEPVFQNPAIRVLSVQFQGSHHYSHHSYYLTTVFLILLFLYFGFYVIHGPTSL